MSDLLAHLRGLPDDWESWLVHADELTARGDERGELLVLEQRGGADRARAWDLVDDWMLTRSELVGESCFECYLWIRSLTPLADPPTPNHLLPVFAQPLSQLIALIDLEAPWLPGDVAPVFERHRERVTAAMLAWIDRAFDGVPPPDDKHYTIRQAEAADNHAWSDRSLDHLGRWQDLPDQELLDNQWALPHLDDRGIDYYAPAIMSFALRQPYGTRWHTHWITESLEYTLQPSEANLRSWQRGKFQWFDRAQRAAIYAYTLVANHPEAAAAWARVWQAERDRERDDWFALFSPTEDPSSESS